MRLKALGSISIPAFLYAVFLATPVAAQTATPAEQQRAGGEKSITGCLVKEGPSYAIKTDSGTYLLNTDRDLAGYLGKEVRIDGKWETSGTFTTAPVGSSSADTAPAAASAPPPGPGSPAFVGDLHLHVTGTVIGDCPK
jgi:hypothetical protein